MDLPCGLCDFGTRASWTDGLRTRFLSISLQRGSAKALPIGRAQLFARETDQEFYTTFCNIVGGVLSPLLSNLMLDDLDKELERRGHRFARYCDDFLIVVKSQRAGERVKASLTRFLQHHLKLEVNESKSTVGPTTECVFLGFTFQGTRIYWSHEAFQDFRHRLREPTGRSWGVSMAYRIRQLNEYIQGWVQYFGLSQYYRPLPELDAWLRRRLRMCFWKQWRSVRTKVRELLKLGTTKKTAILTALSRKGPWHLSRTLATQTGMTNQWLSESLGLVSIRALWIALHYPT
jgi:RNA-directed DNA polymerase